MKVGADAKCFPSGTFSWCRLGGGWKGARGHSGVMLGGFCQWCRLCLCEPGAQSARVRADQAASDSGAGCDGGLGGPPPACIWGLPGNHTRAHAPGPRSVHRWPPAADADQAALKGVQVKEACPGACSSGSCCLPSPGPPSDLCCAYTCTYICIYRSVEFF